MNELELMLQEAGAEIAWPSTPDLASAVRARLRGERPGAAVAGRRRFRGVPIRRPLAIALASLLVATGAAAAVPGIRDPVLDFLGLRSVELERVPRLPAPKPSPGAQLGLGQRTTVEAAQKQVRFQPGFPSGLGKPVVYVDSAIPRGQLGLVYRGGQVLIIEVVGNLSFQFLHKFIPPGTHVDTVVIQGERGLWIHGTPHEIVFQDARGVIRNDHTRLAGDTLVWRHKGLLLRLEGVRSKALALRIARSVRAAP